MPTHCDDIYILTLGYTDRECKHFIFLSTGFFVPFIYLPDYVKSIGISKEDGAWIVCVIGKATLIA